MPSPFPGMDPYLEHPAHFPDLHDSLIFCMREALNAVLPPPYFAGIKSRIWVESSGRSIEPDVDVLYPGGANGTTGSAGVAAVAVAEPVVIHVPQDEFRESFLEIYAARGGERLVTTIEVLSLTNKTPGEHGRELYKKKQKEALSSQVHLVEIDLLRGGTHTTAVPFGPMRSKLGAIDYHICLSRFDQRDDYLVYPIRLAQPLPALAVPLLPGHAPVSVELQPLLKRCYDSGHYERRVRYDEPPVPALSPQQMQWALEILRSQPGRPT